MCVCDLDLHIPLRKGWGMSQNIFETYYQGFSEYIREVHTRLFLSKSRLVVLGFPLSYAHMAVDAKMFWCKG